MEENVRGLTGRHVTPAGWRNSPHAVRWFSASLQWRGGRRIALTREMPNVNQRKHSEDGSGQNSQGRPQHLARARPIYLIRANWWDIVTLTETPPFAALLYLSTGSARENPDQELEAGIISAEKRPEPYPSAKSTSEAE